MDLYYNTSLHVNKEDYNLLDEAREYKKTLTTNCTWPWLLVWF